MSSLPQCVNSIYRKTLCKGSSEAGKLWVCMYLLHVETWSPREQELLYFAWRSKTPGGLNKCKTETKLNHYINIAIAVCKGPTR